MGLTQPSTLLMQNHPAKSGSSCHAQKQTVARRYFQLCDVLESARNWHWAKHGLRIIVSGVYRFFATLQCSCQSKY